MEKTIILQQTASWVLEEMAKNDPAHDARHIQAVVRLTRQLCQSEGADAFRAELLAWLHDLHDDKLISCRACSETEAFLRRMGVSQADIDFVIKGIPYISYRKYPKLDDTIPLEIRIVQDADRIEAMGATGIARTFAYGGANNRSLEESLQHFDDKLLKLYDLLSTDGAKKLAQPRHALLQSFYDAFRQENE